MEMPLGSHDVEASRISKQLAHEGIKVVSQSRGRLYSRRYPSYSFLLEAESAPGPQYCQNDKPLKNPSDPFRNRTLEFTVCSAVPEPTALQRAPKL
jgi:hypothetical protein